MFTVRAKRLRGQQFRPLGADLPEGFGVGFMFEPNRAQAGAFGIISLVECRRDLRPFNRSWMTEADDISLAWRFAPRPKPNATKGADGRTLFPRSAVDAVRPTVASLP